MDQLESTPRLQDTIKTLKIHHDTTTLGLAYIWAGNGEQGSIMNA